VNCENYNDTASIVLASQAVKQLERYFVSFTLIIIYVGSVVMLLLERISQRAKGSSKCIQMFCPSAYTHRIQENCADSTHAKLNIYPRHRLNRLSVNDYKTS